ncbi:hypothetical protein ACFSC3_12250 [Sphingomonas floccifaciens]|uniref:PepSY domain-containing protein n=1 Tax=Sphingomonas floccifaciens TaxID=1844115 RepID=A0ABW4NDW9_9SPHN
MNLVLTALSGLLLSAAAPEPTAQRGDQAAASAARREGRILPLAEIQRRVIPAMQGAKYLGVDFDSGTAVYTLKFLRDGSLIWVMVDGRSGNVIGRSR